MSSQALLMRMVVAAVTLSLIALLVPWQYCMAGDAHGFPVPFIYPRHGEEFMTFGFVTGTKGGGTVYDFSAPFVNASLFVLVACALGFSYRLVARVVRALRRA